MKCRLELHHWVIPCRSFSFGYLPNVCYVNVLGRVATSFCMQRSFNNGFRATRDLKKIIFLFVSNTPWKPFDVLIWVRIWTTLALHYAFCFFISFFKHCLTSAYSTCYNQPTFCCCRPLAKFAPLSKCRVADKKKWYHITIREKKRFTFILFHFLFLFLLFLCCCFFSFVYLFSFFFFFLSKWILECIWIL